jgi:putative hydrolase of the HAD superfamily
MSSFADVVVFDIDDTLYPEFDYVTSGITSAVQHLSQDVRTAFKDAYLKRFCAGQRTGLFQSAGADCGLAVDDELLQKLLQTYRDHHPEIGLSANVVRLLDDLSVKSGLAAISDGDARRQSRKVEALGLQRWITSIILTGALGPGKGKPSPAAFEMVQKSFPGANRFIYVADNSFKDFQAPEAMGWKCVQLMRPNRVHDSPAWPNATIVESECEMASVIHSYLEMAAS